MTKETNPKDLIGATKLPLHLIPDGALAHVSLAFYEGALKYSAYNWREVSVKASVYVSACRRHISKWWNRDSTDPVSRVHHLANAAACLLILLDAEIQGTMDDDRPPPQDLEELQADLQRVQAHLADLYGSKD